MCGSVQLSRTTDAKVKDANTCLNSSDIQLLTKTTSIKLVRVVYATGDTARKEARSIKPDAKLGMG